MVHTYNILYDDAHTKIDNNAFHMYDDGTNYTTNIIKLLNDAIMMIENET